MSGMSKWPMYAGSDRLAVIAQAEFDGITTARCLPTAVSPWVAPSSAACPAAARAPARCRRCSDLPARLAAAFAQGLEPMDFHAAAEALIDGSMRVVDATLLAARASLARIPTGRDAADTAFLSKYGGAADLVSSQVTDSTLPGGGVIDLVNIG